jgi:hypothetical protein
MEPWHSILRSVTEQEPSLKNTLPGLDGRIVGAEKDRNPA